MARILVIVGHARPGTYCEALGQAYAEGARAGGHAVEVIMTARIAFDPILHEGFERVQPLEPNLAAAHDALLAADHIVIVFPLWLGMLPAILKGFLERVLQPDLVEPSKQGRFVKVLKGKTARIVVTMGMPGFIYKWWYGSYAVKNLKRNVLRFMGVGRISSDVFGMIEAAGDARRKAWLDRYRELGKRAA
jgi:putative NADPH-quinone reductase